MIPCISLSNIQCPFCKAVNYCIAYCTFRFEFNQRSSSEQHGCIHHAARRQKVTHNYYTVVRMGRKDRSSHFELSKNKCQFQSQLFLKDDSVGTPRWLESKGTVALHKIKGKTAVPSFVFKKKYHFSPSAP